MTVRAHIGWFGQFTTDEAEGAYPNGTRIRKINADRTDPHRNGATGRVLGSLHHAPLGLAYFIEWDDMPQCAVFALPHQIIEGRPPLPSFTRVRGATWP